MKVTIFSLWRDSQPYIDRALSQLEALEINNKDVKFEYYFYENDSQDDTKCILENFLENREGKLVSENLNATKFGSTIEGERMRAMAKYRNNILYAAKPMDSDYCLLWDSDVEFESDILNKFLKYKDEGGMLCPNIRQNVPCVMGSGDDTTYYDSLSLIDKWGVGCMTWASNPFYDEEDRAKYEQGLPIEVTAAFGGCVLIKTDLLNNKKVEWHSDGKLEHWGLCARILKYTKEKIIFLPNVEVRVQISEKTINEIKHHRPLYAAHQQESMEMTSWERQLKQNVPREDV